MRGISSNLLVGGVTFAIELLFFTMPVRAARFWGQRLDADATNSAWVRRLYRIAGVLLCMAGLLIALDNILYHPPVPPIIKIPPPVQITSMS